MVFHALFSLVVTCDASTSAFIRSLISLRKQIETKGSVSTSTRIKTFTPLNLAQVIWLQPCIQGFSPSPPTTTEGRETNARYEIDLVRN